MRIEKSILSAKLAKVRMAVPGKALGDGVQGVMFKGGEIMAQNYEIRVVTPLPTDSLLSETFVLPIKAIDMINSLPDGEVELLKKDGHIHIISGQIKSKFALIDAGSFNEPKSVKEEKGAFTIDSKKLQELVLSVLYAASTDGSRPVFCGVLFDAVGGELNVVALDGFRAAWNKTEFEGEYKFIVPRASLEKLFKMGITGDVKISIDEKAAVFTSDEYTVYTRLIEGEFLAYRNSFAEYSMKISTNRKFLLEALGRALICVDTHVKTPVKFCFEDGKLVLSLASSLSDYSEKIEINGNPDDGLVIGFNAQYLRDAVKSYDSEDVSMEFGSGVQPMTMTDGNLRSLILPVRLKV